LASGAARGVMILTRYCRLPAALLVSAAVLLAAHLWATRPALDEVLPSAVYEYEVELTFEGFGEDVRLATYLPTSDERQTVIEERLEPGLLAFDERATLAGRLGEWNGKPPEGAHSVRYFGRLSLRAVRFELPSGLGFGAPLTDWARGHLEETEAIPFQHPEIRQLWSRIRPPQSADLEQTLRAILQYTHEQLEPAPFKGYTDALTALRLGQASCNGKSRLFVALARLNGIPARLVGGVILEEGVKRTSHQWVEAYVGGYWVPFDPLNGHFAELPANYLRLYSGDEFLFSHSRDISFDYVQIQRGCIGHPPALEPSTPGGCPLSRFIAQNQQISGYFAVPLARSS
jgi:transglutaminase-like putative cysteine protease